jgi:hypothetical protein
MCSMEPSTSYQLEVVHDNDSDVEWKDVTWEAEMDLSAHLYWPRHRSAANDMRIPAVAYFHDAGSGLFFLGSVKAHRRSNHTDCR